MRKGRIQIAVLGTGSIGQRHIRVLGSLGVGVIAVPARPGRYEELLKAGMPVAAGLEEANKKGAAGVVICTDTSRHVEDCVMALELGMCVLCEKPLAVSAREGRKLIPGCGTNAFVGYNLRFDEGFGKAFTLASRIGEIHYIRAECRSYLPAWRKDRDYRQNYSSRPLEGGVLLDLSHEVDYINFFHEKPIALMGLKKNTGLLGISEEETASAVFEFESKGIGSISVDYLSRRATRKMTISGEKGEIDYDFMGKKIVSFVNGAVRSIEIERGADSLYESEDLEFLKVVDGKEKKRLATIEEAVNALCVVDAWKKSSDSGKKVEIKYAS